MLLLLLLLLLLILLISFRCFKRVSSNNAAAASSLPSDLRSASRFLSSSWKPMFRNLSKFSSIEKEVILLLIEVSYFLGVTVLVELLSSPILPLLPLLAIISLLLF